MVFQEPKIEFVHLASEQITTVSGAGYLLCQSVGLDDGSAIVTNLCEQMHNGMSAETWNCYKSNQAEGNYTPYVPPKITPEVSTPSGPVGPQVDFSLRFDK